MSKHDIEVDARGLFCPLPILRLSRALRERPIGTVALLLATDPVAAEDVNVFCRETSHRLLESRLDGPILSFLVEKVS